MSVSIRYLLSLLICFGLTVSSLTLEPLNETEAGQKTKRILDGEDVEVGQFPYIMAVRMYWDEKRCPEIICSATLISTKSVLGTARCVADYRDSSITPVEKFDGILGSVEENDENKIVRTFKEFRIHEEYLNPDSTGINDIAIYVLNEAVELNENIKTIPLYKRGLTLVGENVISVGWGKSDIHDRMKPRLHYLEATILKPEKCSQYSLFRKNEHLCLAPKHDGQCTVPGDKGGPLILKHSEQDICIGITYSTKYNCNREKPIVQTSISVFKDWISENVEGDVTFVDLSQNPLPNEPVYIVFQNCTFNIKIML